MITFKQFLQEEDDHTLLSKLIQGLLKKGETVQVWAEIWHPDPKRQVPAMYDIDAVDGKRITIMSKNGAVTTWFAMNDDESDAGMSFKKEDGIWTLREKGGKPVQS